MEDVPQIIDLAVEKGLTIGGVLRELDKSGSIRSYDRSDGKYIGTFNRDNFVLCHDDYIYTEGKEVEVYKRLYDSMAKKFIYEIIRTRGGINFPDGEIARLVGPIKADTIRYTTGGEFKYCQIIDSQPKATWKEDELLFLDSEI